VWYGKCPDDFEIEQYCYGQLPVLKAVLVKSHIKRCSRCRDAVAEVERFDRIYLNVPIEEPPRELSSLVMQKIADVDYEVNSDWEFSFDSSNATILGPVDEEVPSSRTRVFLPKLRWVATMFVIIAGIAFKQNFGGYLSLGRGTYIMGWDDIGAFWGLVKSNVVWTTLKQISEALKVDAISTLRVLASSLPSEVFSLLLCSCIVVALCVRKVFSTRSGGYKHEKTL
jgi:anti-sigma factor RsiW